MSKYHIEVEIPDGQYCSIYDKADKNFHCTFLESCDAEAAGFCVLLNRVEVFDNHGQNSDDTTNWNIFKHKDCISLKGIRNDRS